MFEIEESRLRSLNCVQDRWIAFEIEESRPRSVNRVRDQWIAFEIIESCSRSVNHVRDLKSSLVPLSATVQFVLFCLFAVSSLLGNVHHHSFLQLSLSPWQQPNFMCMLALRIVHVQKYIYGRHIHSTGYRYRDMYWDRLAYMYMLMLVWLREHAHSLIHYCECVHARLLYFSVHYTGSSQAPITTMRTLSRSSALAFIPVAIVSSQHHCIGHAPNHPTIGILGICNSALEM